MCVIVQAASGDRRFQAIAEGIVGVEADELGTRPFVGFVLELPFRSAEPFPVPVDDSLPEDMEGVAREVLSCPLCVEAFTEQLHRYVTRC